MKKFKRLALTFVSLAIIVSCSDDDPIPIEQPFGVTDQGANDETAREEYDDAIDNVFNALNNTNLNTGRSPQAVKIPCGVQRIDSTTNSYKFVYGSGEDCGKKVLSGSITAALTTGNQWKDTGAVLTLTFTNYKIEYTNVTPSQSLEYNGAITIENVNGGYVWETFLGIPKKTIIHKIGGALSIKFDDGDTRVWTITKKRQYNTANSLTDLVWTMEQDGSEAEKGINKEGKPFTTEITTPIEWHFCPEGSDYILKAFKGKWVHTVAPNSVSAEAGYKYNSSSPTYVGDCTSDGFYVTYNILGRTSNAYIYY